MPIRSVGPGTHFKGPLLGAPKGPFAGTSVGLTSRFRGPYREHLELFESILSEADLAACGWTQSDNGTTGTATIARSGAQGGMIMNPGTTADTGISIQNNVIPAETKVSRTTLSVGPVVSTTTLMDNRELIWATRVGFLQGTGTAWTNKAVLGWAVTDTALMTPTTGVLAVTTGGGAFFHITEAGQLNAVVQGTTVATSADTGIDIGTLSTAFGNFLDLAIRIRWVDASAGTGVAEFYVNGTRTNVVNGATTALPMQSTQTYSSTFEILNGPTTSPAVDMLVEYLYTGITRAGLTYPYTSGLNL